MGTPGDVVGAVVFLASSAADYVTGQNVHVDGGFTAW
jgi:NAD(P)-dependent dehydrogenase (short-subunit alcohol dehydrogenase family)